MNRDYIPTSNAIRRALGMQPESSFEKAFRESISQLLSKERLGWYWEDAFGKGYDLFDNRPSSLLLMNMPGVYIIWHEEYGGIIRQAVYVGQGNIGERLSKHRSEWDILKYYCIDNRKLHIAWTIESNEDRRLGIENYLHDNLNPLESSKSSNQQPIPVSLPWDYR